MARVGLAFLDTNDRFPEMEFSLVSGGSFRLPEEIGPGYGVVLSCRGHW